ncbi:MAG: DNA polymerase III subunit epsilon [Chloroflexi bacterium]|nr:DNA polymerase III subunit epsilon [Chloroflexota bacterium]
MFNQRMVALDVEATGLDEFDDEIIEVAAVRFEGEKELDTLSLLINPNREIPYKITRLTHITNEMVADAPIFAHVRKQIADFVGDDPIVGHSVDFDIKMLAQAGLRFKQPSVDTYTLATLIVPSIGSFRLGDLIQKLSVEMPDAGDAHRALFDAQMSHRLFVALYNELCQRDMEYVDEILRISRNIIQWSLRTIFEHAKVDIARGAFSRPLSPRVVRSLDDYIPLEPTGSSQVIQRSTIQRMFSTSGVLGRMFPGYEQRDAQVTMSQAVADGFNRSQHVIVEAGTGTGKGMAYLVPAALHAMEHGQRVVLATHTINLQDQLYFKDIPKLIEMFDAELHHQSQEGKPYIPDVALQSALLKGRSNYLCLHRLEESKSTTLGDDEAKVLLKVAAWANHTTSGDRNEISLFDREMLVWDRLHASFDLCKGPGCLHFDQCWFFHARRKAEAAHLVVVNHALLLADMVIDSPILPAYDLLVIDEAHNLEDVATDQFGWSSNQKKLVEFFDGLLIENSDESGDGLLVRLPTFLKGSTASSPVVEQFSRILRDTKPALERARQSSEEFFALLTRLMEQYNESNAHDTRLRITDTVRASMTWQSLIPVWDNLSLQLRIITQQLETLNRAVTELADASIPDYEVLVTLATRSFRFVSEFVENANQIIIGLDASLITWIRYSDAKNILDLNINPLEVATLLNERLFSKKASVVLTSATLSVNNSFTYMQQRLGAPVPPESCYQLESPYNYKDQVLVYIPQDISEPKDFPYQGSVEQAILDTAVAAQGRTLVLFTSNSALRTTYSQLVDQFSRQDIILIGQGLDGSNRQILERFKSEPRSVLFGTLSFWEGVDVVGDALSALIITKLPFSVPNDPVIAARSEQFVDSFNQYFLPQSILKFKQGFGRLVRAKDDRGIVIVLDKRILAKKYGTQFLESLPETTVRTGPLRAIESLVRRTVKST